MCVFSGDRLLVLPVEGADLAGRRSGGVLRAAVGLRVHGDGRRAATPRARAGRAARRRHIPYHHHFLQRLLDVRGHAVSLFP